MTCIEAAAVPWVLSDDAFSKQPVILSEEGSDTLGAEAACGGFAQPPHEVAREPVPDPSTSLRKTDYYLLATS